MLTQTYFGPIQIAGVDSFTVGHQLLTTTTGALVTSATFNAVAVQTVSGNISVTSGPATQTITGSFSAPAVQTVSGNISVTSGPASQTVNGSVSIVNLPALQTVTGSITTTPVTTQTIAQGSSWTVASGPVSQTVTGAVSVSNLPATQTITGSASITNLPATQTITGSASITNLPATQTVSVNNTITVQAGPATQTVNGSISISAFPATQTVAVSGSVTATPVGTQTIAVSSGTQTVVANAVGLFVTPAGSSFPVTPSPDYNVIPLAITVSGGTSSFTVSNSSTYQSGVITIYGNTAWSATTTLAFEASSDSSSYFPLPVTPLGSPLTSLVTVATGTSTGNYLVNLGGFNVVRVRAVSFQSGDNVQANYRFSSSKNTTYLNGSLPAGSNVIGGVTQSGTWTVATSSPATQTIAGSASITNLPATQTVTSATGFFATTQTIAGSASITNLPATQTVTSAGGFFATTQTIAGSASITNLPATQTVTSAGGFFATTQTIAGSISVTSGPATQTVSVINTNAQPTYGTSNQSITCTLNSLSTGSFTLSTAITNTSFQDILLAGRFVTGSSGVSGQGSIVIIGAGSSDGGTTWPLNSLECAVISVLSANANTYTVTLGSTAVAQAFGGYLPQQIKFGVLNNSGASLASSGNSLWYQAVNTQI